MASAQEGFLQSEQPHRQLGWNLVPEEWDIDYVDPEAEAKKAEIAKLEEEAAKLQALLEQERLANIVEEVEAPEPDQFAEAASSFWAAKEELAELVYTEEVQETAAEAIEQVQETVEEAILEEVEESSSSFIAPDPITLEDIYDIPSMEVINKVESEMMSEEEVEDMLMSVLDEQAAQIAEENKEEYHAAIAAEAALEGLDGDVVEGEELFFDNEAEEVDSEFDDEEDLDEDDEEEDDDESDEKIDYSFIGDFEDDYYEFLDEDWEIEEALLSEEFVENALNVSYAFHDMSLFQLAAAQEAVSTSILTQERAEKAQRNAVIRTATSKEQTELASVKFEASIAAESIALFEQERAGNVSAKATAKLDTLTEEDCYKVDGKYEYLAELASKQAVLATQKHEYAARSVARSKYDLDLSYEMFNFAQSIHDVADAELIEAIANSTAMIESESAAMDAEAASLRTISSANAIADRYAILAAEADAAALAKARKKWKKKQKQNIGLGSLDLWDNFDSMLGVIEVANEQKGMAEHN